MQTPFPPVTQSTGWQCTWLAAIGTTYRRAGGKRYAMLLNSNTCCNNANLTLFLADVGC
jgi:hypothetical protein